MIGALGARLSYAPKRPLSDRQKFYVVSSATQDAHAAFIERMRVKTSPNPPSAWQITPNRSDAFDFKVQGLAQDFCERLNTKGLAHRLPNNGRVWHVANVI